MRIGKNHGPRHYMFQAQQITGLRGYCITGEKISPAAFAMQSYIDDPPKYRTRSGRYEAAIRVVKQCKHLLKKMYPKLPEKKGKKK